MQTYFRKVLDIPIWQNLGWSDIWEIFRHLITAHLKTKFDEWVLHKHISFLLLHENIVSSDETCKWIFLFFSPRKTFNYLKYPLLIFFKLSNIFRTVTRWKYWPSSNFWEAGGGEERNKLERIIYIHYFVRFFKKGNSWTRSSRPNWMKNGK